MSKPFERILIVMFENQYRSYVLHDPFMRKLAAAGADMSNFFGAFHPSQTNYLASLAGEICGVTNDDPPSQPLVQKTLVDLLENVGVTWKAYMEGYPGQPWNPAWTALHYPDSQAPIVQHPSSGPRLARYFRKHNAFASFHTIQSRDDRWAHIVDDVAFWNDVGGGTLPQYGWFTPDIWNDGHYLYNTHVDTNPRTQLVAQLSSWLEYVFLGKIDSGDVQTGRAPETATVGLHLDIDLLLSDPAEAWARSRVPAGTLIVITFDEADFDAVGYDTSYDGPNQIYTVLLGDMIRPGSEVSTPFNHYSLIKTVEKNFGCGDLAKNDRHANWLRFLWGESFSWRAPAASGLTSAGPMALAMDGDDPVIAFADADGRLHTAGYADRRWSSPVATGLQPEGALALAGTPGGLLAVFVGTEGALYWSQRDADGQWSAAQSLGQYARGAIALADYDDQADQVRRQMLCWRDKYGFIRYLTRTDGQWAASPGAVGQLTDGPMALAQMGPSLFLVYKERNTRRLRYSSYNLAPFNAFAAVDFKGNPAPANDTSLHAWSPADHLVGQFAGKMGAVQNDYQAHGPLAMAAIEGEMHLVHRGAYADRPGAYTEFFGLTGIFTASSALTNGYGTLRQAGWTAERLLPGIELDPDSAIALAGNPRQLFLVWREANSNALHFSIGGYARSHVAVRQSA